MHNRNFRAISVAAVAHTGVGLRRRNYSDYHHTSSLPGAILFITLRLAVFLRCLIT